MEPQARSRLERAAPVGYFGVSAVFHYLGPSLAVLLFAHVAALGVMWLRVGAAAVVLAVWRRPWRALSGLDRRQRLHLLLLLLALGSVVAVMNSLFYLAVARLPLATVGAIEFLGTIVLAAVGVRSRRNGLALVLTVAGVAILTVIRVGAQPLGFAFAFGNCVGFSCYIVLGHKIANSSPLGGSGAGVSSAGVDGDGARVSVGGRRAAGGIDRLAGAMAIAAVVAAPAGLGPALPAVAHPAWLAWGIGVGICSSVIPYVTDQLVMARLPRATFALMTALLPVFATVIGAVVLGQVPSGRDLAGIALVILGVSVHRS